jgi:hypothetical protein
MPFRELNDHNKNIFIARGCCGEEHKRFCQAKGSKDKLGGKIVRECTDEARQGGTACMSFEKFTFKRVGGQITRI